MPIPKQHNIIGRWPGTLDENGLLHDFSGNGNHGTLVSAPPQIETPFGSSLDLDGSGDYTTNTTANFRNSDNSGTISALIKSTDTSASIFMTSDTGTDTSFFGIDIRSDGTFRIRQQNANDTLDEIRTTNTVNDGIWHHIVVTSSGTSYQMYIDGVIETLVVVGGANNGDWFSDTTLRDNFTIGVLLGTSTSNFFNGVISHIIIWDTNLSGNDILQLNSIVLRLTARR